MPTRLSASPMSARSLPASTPASRSGSRSRAARISLSADATSSTRSGRRPRRGVRQRHGPFDRAQLQEPGQQTRLPDRARSLDNDDRVRGETLGDGRFDESRDIHETLHVANLQHLMLLISSISRESAARDDVAPILGGRSRCPRAPGPAAASATPARAHRPRRSELPRCRPRSRMGRDHRRAPQQISARPVRALQSVHGGTLPPVRPASLTEQLTHPPQP